MKINWLVIGLVVIGAIALIFFLIRLNAEDEGEFENKLNNDVKKSIPKESEQDDTII